ncbi:MAG: YtxH domain-containing protein [Bacteroidetes bacterium]|nr:MAG: YtxH domain-containing protein [Bacteroidota bacterium]
MKEHSWGRTLRAGAWGVLLGGAAGFALGLLVAPEEGRKLRRRLVYQLERLAGQVGEIVEDLLHPEVVGEARRDADAIVADAQARARRIREDIDELLGEVRQQRPPRPRSSTAE